MTIRAYFSDDHALHAPAAEYMHGHTVTFFEMPRRVENIRNSLEAAGLITVHAPDQTVSIEELGQVHAPDMIAYLQALSNNAQTLIRKDLQIYHMGDQVRGDEYYYESVFPPRLMGAGKPDQRKFYIYDNTSPVGAGTWQAVLSSANVAYSGAMALLAGEKQVFAICRPPGHHAGPDSMGGYCYINNAALAAHKLKQNGKVAILDIDYHHGNGTQAIFWNDPEVLFISIHADPLMDYPYYSGFRDEIGGLGAEHTNLNLPLPHGSDEAAFLNALEESIRAIMAFAPNSLVVSLGFDTFKEDPIAHFLLDLSSYHKVGRMISALHLPTLYVQEGGYTVDKLGDMAVSFFHGVVE